MNGGAQLSDRYFRISPVDRRGHAINPVVLAAAEDLARRAIRHAERQLVDPALAATQLEQAAATVSRVVEARKRWRQNDVHDLPSYIFRAFIRRINRLKKRQLSVESAVHTLAEDARNSTDPRGELEMKILIDEFLARCDAVTRDMFYRRVQGSSWEEIGSSYGLSSHSAASRFSQALRRIAERLGLRS
jgi:DNA-directed RNA polymerase specialized sigma24 family protein